MSNLPVPSSTLRRGLSVLFNRADFHEPVVDGVRAIAILWVFLFHIFFFHFGTYFKEALAVFGHPATKWIAQGIYGVDMFFVISGYLIGFILLREQQKTNHIQLRRFYARRFLRLVPVYVFVMCLGAYFLRNIPITAIKVEFAPSGNIENAWTNLLYVNNFLSFEKQYMPWCWSLAIEEQFYLIVPLLLLFLVGRTRRPLAWMLVLLFLSGLIRLAIIRSYGFVPPYKDLPGMSSWSLRFDVIYDKLHVRYGGLLAGVIGAYCSIYHKDAVVKFFSNPLRTTVIGVLSLAVIVLTAYLPLSSDKLTKISDLARQIIHSHMRDAFCIAVLFIILIAIHGSGVLARTMNRILSARFLYPISQLSYSVYLLHEMLMMWMFPRTTPYLVERFELEPAEVMFVNGVVVTILTFVGACLLYVFIERPCMEFRKTSVFRRWFESAGNSKAPTAT